MVRKVILLHVSQPSGRDVKHQPLALFTSSPNEEQEEVGKDYRGSVLQLDVQSERALLVAVQEGADGK